MQHLLEYRQHAHHDESVRSSALALGALLLEVRLNKAIEAALAHPTPETCIQGDASLSLVLNLYAVTLMTGSMRTPRLVRPLGLALVYDVVRTVNACLYISRTSQYIASSRKQHGQDKGFAQLLEDVGDMPKYRSRWAATNHILCLVSCVRIFYTPFPSSHPFILRLY